MTIDDKLFKLLLLLPNEVKEVKISPQLKIKVKVIDIKNRKEKLCFYSSTNVVVDVVPENKLERGNK